MNTQVETPSVRSGGLVTVAFLKAQLDSGSDHLGIFMPLVIEAVARSQATSVVALDVQNGIAEFYGIGIPQQTIDTLLKRATRKGWLRRQDGRFWVEKLPSVPNIPSQMSGIYEAQRHLADALVEHAKQRGIQVDRNGALQMLLRFLEDEQVAILLHASAETGKPTTAKERTVIAEFIDLVVMPDQGLRAALNAILEGLVLYHAAFLPDLQDTSRRFGNLNVYFDSDLVRQALGYEGPAMQALLRDTISVLKGEGARCLVFDKTVGEIERILEYFESHLATAHGRLTLRPSPMARHILVNRYSPSDMRQMAALLRDEISREGLRVVSTPQRIPEFVRDEKALTETLQDPQARDMGSLRIQHDVDCIAAIETIREGHTSERLDDCRAVFASASVRVIRNVQAWYRSVERGVGIEPIVHIRAITNLAWLKQPALRARFKEHELIALCAAAMRPSQETWQRFLRHLQILERSEKITSDETALILVSRMSDQLLRDAEVKSNGDISNAVLDDVVERVKYSYVERYEEQIADERARASSRLSLAQEQIERMQEERFARDAAIRRKSQSVAHLALIASQGLIVVIVAFVAIALMLVNRTVLSTSFGVGILVALLAYVVFAMLAPIELVREKRVRAESELAVRLEGWMKDGLMSSDLPRS